MIPTTKITTRIILPMMLLTLLVVGGTTIGAAETTADPIAQVDDQLEDEVENQTADRDDRDEDEDQDEDEDDDRDSIIYQFENGGELVSVEYDDRTAYVELKSTDGPTRFWIAEGGLEGSGSFSFENVRVLPGGTTTVAIPVDNEAVSVTSGNDGYYHEGQLGITVITGTPTDQLLQLSAISGTIGTIIALGIVIGQLKRKNENTYLELFSDKRHDIESDPVEGFYEWVARGLKNTADSKYRLGIAAVIGTYVFAVLFGYAPGPGEIWLELEDSQRLIVAGSIGATILAIVPVYLLVKRIWNPNREFVLDLDSKDVYKAADGDKSGSIGVYSAPPSRVSQLEVDGATTTIGTPGGRCHLVRGFDPEDNTAEGNPPDLADDRAVSIEVQKIEHNRQILTDLASIGRDLIGAMSAFRVTADASAMRDIDAGLRDTLSAGPDSLEDVLIDAVRGTRYEGTYQSDMRQQQAQTGPDDQLEDHDRDDRDGHLGDDRDDQLEGDQ